MHKEYHSFDISLRYLFMNKIKLDIALSVRFPLGYGNQTHICIIKIFSFFWENG